MPTRLRLSCRALLTTVIVDLFIVNLKRENESKGEAIAGKFYRIRKFYDIRNRYLLLNRPTAVNIGRKLCLANRLLTK